MKAICRDRQHKTSKRTIYWLTGGDHSRGLPALADVAAQIRQRQVSAVELVTLTLQRIGILDTTLNAYITILADEAMNAAKRADQEIASGAYRGPLHGVPVSVKDLFWTAGVRTTAGSRVLANFVPTEDATLVRRVREAGAIIVGKTNMLEFAYASFHPDYGPTKNPWSLDRTALDQAEGRRQPSPPEWISARTGATPAARSACHPPSAALPG
jgi:hypothetical protein